MVREKEHLRYGIAGAAAKRLLPPDVVSDEMIVLRGVKTVCTHPESLRRIRTRVEVDGQIRGMVFLPNNHDRVPRTIAKLFRVRWQGEVLFKKLKQTLQLRGFSTGKTGRR